MNEEKKYWLDDPRHIDLLYGALWAFCVVLVLVGRFFMDPKEVHFSWELFSGFAFFGFLAYSFIVFAGKLFRKVVRREEDYYDR